VILEQLSEVNCIFIKHHSSNFTSSSLADLGSNEGVNSVSDHLFPHIGISGAFKISEVDHWSARWLLNIHGHDRNWHGQSLWGHRLLSTVDWDGLGRILVLLVLKTTIVVSVRSCLAFVVTTATASSSGATTIVPGATIVILLLLVWGAFLVLLTWGILPPLAATLTLIDGIGDTRLVQILCTVVSTLVGAECRRVLLLILVMI
jgi:hypothetical protein